MAERKRERLLLAEVLGTQNPGGQQRRLSETVHSVMLKFKASKMSVMVEVELGFPGRSHAAVFFHPGW